MKRAISIAGVATGIYMQKPGAIWNFSNPGTGAGGMAAWLSAVGSISLFLGRDTPSEPNNETDDGIPKPDPCAGVKPYQLINSRVRPYRQGGVQSAEQHIRSLHMSGNIRRASQYFGTFNMVKSYNRLTFMVGTRHTSTNGGIVFELELPFPIGIDKYDPSNSSNWNLLRLEKDCKTVDTSHVGRIK